jgi:hypothetical protein
MARFGVNEPPILTVGMKIMFLHKRSWFVGEILRFDGERALIEHQQKKAEEPRKWIHVDDVQPLPNSTPKSGFLGPDG